MPVLTFPLTFESFWQTLPIAKDTFEISSAVDVSRTGGGEVITAERGASLWTGKIDLGPLTHAEARAIVPLLNLLKRPGATFAVADSARPGPLLNPGGPGTAPTVLALGADPRELSLTGLPAGYTLSRGDRIWFTYAGRGGLHEVVSTVTANGSGQTALFEVNPPLRPGLTPGTSVPLAWPRCRAVLLPETLSLGVTSHTITTGISFGWIQTLRS